MVKQVRKKPLVVFGWKIDFNSSTFNRDMKFMNSLGAKSGTCVSFVSDRGQTYIQVHTLEGVMVGHDGDWILCGVKNELYPCAKDIFEETYMIVGNVDFYGDRR